MKKQIDMKMLTIQQESDRDMKKKEDKSVLNKSLDAVTNVFKGKWWGWASLSPKNHVFLLI